MKRNLLAWIAISSAACGGRLSLGDLGGGGAGAGGEQATAGGAQAIGGGAQAIGGGAQTVGGGAQTVGGGAQTVGGGAQAIAGAEEASGTSVAGSPSSTLNPSLPGTENPGVSRGSAGSVCYGTGTRVLTAADALLDDFEGPAPVAAWSNYNDAYDTQGEPNLYLTRVSGGAEGNFAGLFKPDLDQSTGVMYDVAVDPPAGISCADVSVFTGLSFWAKPGPGTGEIDVIFLVPSQNPVQRDNLGRSIGGDCPGPFKDCYQFPMLTVAMTSQNWTHYTVPFADVANSESKLGIIDRLIQKIAFERDFATATGNKSFRLDDVRFY